MKVVIITGSPHRKGTSALLADEFIRGLQDAGHETFRFDAAFSDVKGCLGCNHCRKTGEPCVHHDDMENLVPYLLEADAVAFVTPIYYFGMSSQLKTVLDRFYAPEKALMGDKKAFLMVSAGSPKEAIAQNLIGLYQDVVGWMQWENAGEILALGCYSREDIEKSEYPRQAYELGKGVFME